MTKRILVVSNFFPPEIIGGAEVIAYRQAKALAEQGDEVRVFAGKPGSDGLPPGSLSVDVFEGLPVHRLTLRSLEPDDNFHWPAARRKFQALLNTFQPDVVHFNNTVGLGLDLIVAAKLFGARVIVSLQDYWGFCFKNTVLRNTGKVCDDVEVCAVCRPSITSTGSTVKIPMRLRRDYVALCLGYADALIGPSQHLTDAYNASGLISRPVTRVSLGIDLTGLPVKTPRAPDGVVRFACFSYLGEHKGIATLLDACARLALRPELAGRWSLTIAGDGHLAAQMARDIAAGRFGDHVIQAGRLDRGDAVRLAADSDVTVLASVWPENEPVSLLEATAVGSAQIASRMGGSVELVDDGESGFLFEAGDDADLAEVMARMIQDPELVRRFGAYNAARRDRHDERIGLERIYALEGRAPDRFEEVVVICGGGAPPEGAHLLVHQIHRLEDPSRRLRLVWHDWADAEIWRRAAAVWIWADEDEQAVALALRASRAGVPIVAPSTARLASLVHQDGQLGTYDTLLEALGLLAALPDEPAMSARTAGKPGAARLLAVVAPRPAFALGGGVGA